MRECQEETGLQVEITGIVDVFSTPDHLIAHLNGDRVKEVRQPVNICLRARPVGVQLHRTPEAAEVAWVEPGDLDRYEIHPAIGRRMSTACPRRSPTSGRPRWLS